jgi:putative two-component system response regulator
MNPEYLSGADNIKGTSPPASGHNKERILIMDQQPRILIIDDSAITRAVLKSKLEVHSSAIIFAEDGEQGWELALSEDIDLIISDIEMPRLDGFELCQRLKSNDRTRGIPVIILSSLEADMDIEKGFTVGAAAYVAKSEAHLHLIEIIEKVLKRFRFSRSRCILVVDDSALIRKMVSRSLEEAGFQVMIAENGKQGLARIKERQPDLIISDIKMPEMDGIEFCKKTHDDPNLAIIPFIVMSTNSERGIMRRLFDLGASSYLVKPFNMEQLVITVERLLSDNFLILLKQKQTYCDENKMILSGITGLVEAMEARDPFRKGHSESVSRTMAQIAQQMNVGAEDMDSVIIAGRIHDIGMVTVPDAILQKPGKLTEEEFAVIRKHPAGGFSILESIPSIQPLLPVILQHHERFDGKGYPNGLKGQEILLWARIATMADTYNALTNNRSYRPCMNHEEAMAVIESVRGTQLCPDCVDAFKEIPPFELDSFKL